MIFVIWRINIKIYTTMVTITNQT